MSRYKESDYKKSLIREYELSEIKIGDVIYVHENNLNPKTQTKINKLIKLTVDKVNSSGVYAIENDRARTMYKINPEDIIRDTINIGHNPINWKINNIRSVNYTLESILHDLDINQARGASLDKYVINGIQIGGVNWDPFIFDKEGTLVRYQRPFVWSEDDERNLIDSIYNGIDCGHILVRDRSFKELEHIASKGITELYFKDIIDGKQRLNTIKRFMNDEFTDSYGKYYSDISNKDQHRFLNHSFFTYSIMAENSSDELVIGQFLKMNFCGVPQGKEHIEYVKQIMKIIL